MKSLHRTLIVSIVATIAFTFSIISPALASGSLNVSYSGGGRCGTTSVSLPAQVSSNFSTTTSFHEVFTVNGIGIGTFNGTQPAGKFSYPGNFGAPFPAQSFPYTFRNVTSFPGFNVAVSAVCNSNGGAPIVTVDFIGGGASGPIFDDGRINMDALETAAIYCMGDGSVRVYVPAVPLWIIAFDASPAEIAKVPTKPAKNTLIKSGKGAFLYRLTTGELQINATSNYVYTFKDCPKPQ